MELELYWMQWIPGLKTMSNTRSTENFKHSFSKSVAQLGERLAQLLCWESLRAPCSPGLESDLSLSLLSLALGQIPSFISAATTGWMPFTLILQQTATLFYWTLGPILDAILAIHVCHSWKLYCSLPLFPATFSIILLNLIAGIMPSLGLLIPVTPQWFGYVYLFYICCWSLWGEVLNPHVTLFNEVTSLYVIKRRNYGRLVIVSPLIWTAKIRLSKKKTECTLLKLKLSYTESDSCPSR